nr:winged helix DNA-binding domain-containing protein [Agromyces seonyuensis]
MLAVQAQEYVPAQFGLAQRIDPAVRPALSEVSAVIDDGRLLRTHLLRPTWHFVLPEDADWLTELSIGRIRAAMRQNLRVLGVEPTDLARSLDLVAACVAPGGPHRTRDEIGAAIDADGPNPFRAGMGMVTLLLLAELERLVISGASLGAQRTYAAWNDRVPPTPGLDRPEALARVAARYLPARGPASRRDLAAWASLTLRDADAGLAAAVDAGLAEAVDIDGEPHFVAPGALDAPPAAIPSPVLVQAYDETIMGYGAPRALLAPERPHRFADFPLHWLLVDGRLAGKWSLTLAPREAQVRLVEVPVGRRGLPTRLQPVLDELSTFLERPVVLEFEPDAAGAVRRNRPGAR